MSDYVPPLKVGKILACIREEVLPSLGGEQTTTSQCTRGWYFVPGAKRAVCLWCSSVIDYEAGGRFDILLAEHKMKCSFHHPGHLNARNQNRPVHNLLKSVIELLQRLSREQRRDLLISIVKETSLCREVDILSTWRRLFANNQGNDAQVNPHRPGLRAASAAGNGGHEQSVSPPTSPQPEATASPSNEPEVTDQPASIDLEPECTTAGGSSHQQALLDPDDHSDINEADRPQPAQDQLEGSPASTGQDYRGESGSNTTNPIEDDASKPLRENTPATTKEAEEGARKSTPSVPPSPDTAASQHLREEQALLPALPTSTQHSKTSHNDDEQHQQHQHQQLGAVASESDALTSQDEARQTEENVTTRGDSNKDGTKFKNSSSKQRQGQVGATKDEPFISLRETRSLREEYAAHPEADTNGISPQELWDVLESMGSSADPQHPEYAHVSQRLKSFHSWRHGRISPRDIAEDGFFYTGQHDADIAVTCFHCGGSALNYNSRRKLRKYHGWHFPCCRQARVHRETP